MSELPTMGSSNYMSSTTNLDALNCGGIGFGASAPMFHMQDNMGGACSGGILAVASIPPPTVKPKKEQPMTRRLVKVLIADTNENIPLDKMVLYSGEEKLTDANDQELFFEININRILEEHNKHRVKINDRKVKERIELLEPARIRDLKMVVVTVATF